MLQTQTVEPGTLSLLKKVMEDSNLIDFNLVGGTALSLLYGHRKSIDLDLFCNSKFDTTQLNNYVSKSFNDVLVEEKPAFFGLFCFIDEVKVDFVKYPHDRIRDLLVIDGIRMYSNEDIIAMKIQAILGRAKKKDFWDIAELLNHYSVPEFIQFHREKFSTQNLLITVPQAMTYFDDAEEDEDPISLKGQTWESVKEVIREKVRSFLKKEN